MAQRQTEILFKENSEEPVFNHPKYDVSSD